jgi:hypothetical protein
MTDGVWTRADDPDPITRLRHAQIARLIDVLAARGAVDPHALLAVLTELVDGQALTRDGLAAIFGGAVVDGALGASAATPEAIGIGAVRARARLRHALRHARRRTS